MTITHKKQSRADAKASLARFLAANLNLDATSSMFVATQLQEIETKLYESPKAPLKSDVLIPPIPVSRGVRERGYDRITSRGMAKFIAGNGTDYPLVNADKRRYLTTMHDVGIGYEYTQADLEAAAYGNVPLDATYAAAARDGTERLIDQAWLIGSADIGATGLFNDPNVPRGNAGVGNWAAATADQILADLNEIARAVWVTTREHATADTLVMSPERLALIRSLPRSTNSDTTVARFFLENQEYIKGIESSSYLSTAGVGGTQRMVAYRRNLDTLGGPLASRFEQLAPQYKGQSIHIPCRAVIGPLEIKAPIFIVYRDGI